MTATTSDELTRRRLDVVRAHMASENEHDFDTTLATFAHPRYELIPTGQVFDGDRPDGIVCERVYYDLHSILRQLGLAGTG